MAEREAAVLPEGVVVGAAMRGRTRSARTTSRARVRAAVACVVTDDAAHQRATAWWSWSSWHSTRGARRSSPRRRCDRRFAPALRRGCRSAAPAATTARGSPTAGTSRCASASVGSPVTRLIASSTAAIAAPAAKSNAASLPKTRNGRVRVEPREVEKQDVERDAEGAADAVIRHADRPLDVLDRNLGDVRAHHVRERRHEAMLLADQADVRRCRSARYSRNVVPKSWMSRPITRSNQPVGEPRRPAPQRILAPILAPAAHQIETLLGLFDEHAGCLPGNAAGPSPSR